MVNWGRWTCSAVFFFPRRDISAASRGIHLKNGMIVRLPSGSRQPHKIARDQSPAVDAHRMRRVTAQRGDRPFVVPEADRLEERVNRSLGRFAGLLVTHIAAASELWFAVGPDPAAVPGHSFAPGPTPAPARGPPRRLQGSPRPPGPT